MTTYCFIANYHLTPLQIELARRLGLEGINCVFIAVNSGLAAEIYAAGWSPDRVLHLTFNPSPDEPVFDAVPVKFNDLLTADRALRFMPEKGLRFLYAAARRMNAFFERHDVRLVFSEPTWAHERLAAALCAGSGRRKFLTPFTVRYPSGRWGFFEGGDQDMLHPTPAVTLGSAVPVHEPAEVLNAGPPAYLQRNDQLLYEAKSIRARFDRLRRFVTRERIDPLDPTHIQSRWNTLRVKGGEESNRIRYRGVRRVPVDKGLLRQPFVLYALHKQPESSIDVLGRYYEDQAALLHAIWRSLPAGWKLLVKEHTNAIGDRPPSFYRELIQRPGLIVIDETVPMPVLLGHTRAVFTVSGTVAYEAAMKGVAAFTFAPMFFNRFPRSRRITIEDLRAVRDIAALIEMLPPHDAQAAAAVLKDIVQESFPGRFTDVISDPGVLEEENMRMLMSGFRTMRNVA